MKPTHGYIIVKPQNINCKEINLKNKLERKEILRKERQSQWQQASHTQQQMQEDNGEIS